MIPVNSFLGTLVLRGLYPRHSAASGHFSSRAFSKSRADWRLVPRALTTFRRVGWSQCCLRGLRDTALAQWLPAMFLSRPQCRSTDSGGCHGFSQSSKHHPVRWHQPHGGEGPDPGNAAPNSSVSPDSCERNGHPPKGGNEGTGM